MAVSQVERSAANYRRNKAERDAYSKAWAKKNPEARRAIARRWKAKNPAKMRGYILKRYGLSAADEAALLRAQGDACAICREAFTGKICIDHCHATGRVRGLLCDACNLGIGKLHDDPELCSRAAAYLSKAKDTLALDGSDRYTGSAVVPLERQYKTMADVEDVFAGMANAEAPGRGTYINDSGTFRVQIVKAFGKSGFRGKAFIVEFKVLESSIPDLVPVNSTRSWTVKWDKVQNHADLKAFALAATGLEDIAASKREAAITATYMVYAAAGALVAGDAATKAAALLGADAPTFEGCTVYLDTEKTKTMAGGDFTRHKWSPVD